MSDSPDVITVTGHGPPETVTGLGRGVICCAAAVAIAWHTPDVARYALGVVALVASPALARAVVAPMLARILRNAH